MPDLQGAQLNEAELITQAQAGQLSAFGTLIAFYQQRLYNLALQLTGSADDAAELTQETFLRGLRAIGHFQRRSKFYTWMVRIMVNLSNDLREKARREARHFASRAQELLHHSQAAAMAGSANPARRLEEKEAQELITRELDALEPQLKQALVLREFEQLSYRQIAEIMNTSEGTVKSRLFRARESLRLALVPYVRND